MDIVLLALVLIVGFYMLWNIGANDVANAVGTSVGSGAVTIKEALIIAAVLEFSGALILGSNVSETIQSGIINPSHFTETPMVFALGMLSALLATALWLQAATFFKWPVSTTHAIIGALVGFGVVAAGVDAIEWRVVGTIVMSWLLSPSISALLAYFIFLFIQKKILSAYSPLLATRRIAPLLTFIVLVTFTTSVLANGIHNLRFSLNLYQTILVAIGVGLVGTCISLFFYKKIHVDAKGNKVIAVKQEQQLYNLHKAHRYLLETKLASQGKMSLQLGDMLTTVSDLIENVKDKTRWESHLSADYVAVEKIFAGLQILTACFVAFAHGANDVANAVGPVSAIWQIISHPASIALKTNIPIWLLAFGGFGIVFGLATYGWRVIDTIGKQITQLTPTRGFAAEFAAASTILVASKLGLPISTTHAIVGAVIGVGLARGFSALNFGLIGNIFLSWIITIPSAAISSILIFYLLKLFFI
ncbi:MAG: inorganic phosphate transporter [Verrucomicrobia bacterium]|nr:inorganic phosphate transporter [Verrucomicrobiota bacterium]